MKKIYLFFILILVAVCSSALTYYFYWHAGIEKVQEFKMDVTVTTDGSVGFNLDRDAIHFGSFGPGASSTRKINLTSSNHTTYVHVRTKGEIADWIGLSQNPVVIPENSYKELVITAKAPRGTDPATYNGTLILIFREE